MDAEGNALGRWAARRRRALSVAAIAASALVLGACLVVRVLGAKWYALHGNPDYAVVVLMVRHILAGVDFPVFFYGQSYMGSLEPAFSALLGLFLGPTPFAVCLGTALLAFAMIAAVHRLAWRVAGPVAAVAASALCLIGPAGYFHYVASPRGGYALGLLLTVLLLHDAVFLGADGVTVRARRFLPLGLIVGLGFWNFWLTMPAVATAGAMLLWRLRLRLIRPAVLGWGSLGFFLGSLPWWVWNIGHEWQSLGATSGAGGLGQSFQTARLLFFERLPALFANFHEPAGKPLAAAAILLLALPLVVAFLPRRPDAEPSALRRLLWASALFTGAFAAAYAFSSFGTVNSARYLLPFVPLFAVLAGSGVGATLRSAAVARHRGAIAALLLAAAAGIVCIGVEVGGHLPDLKGHRAVKTRWHASALTLASHPDLPKAYFADFMLYGINWATEEQVCAVSPTLYRYAPYFDRLENADSPGVLENFRGFDHFLSNTCATAKFMKLPGNRVHYDVTPPKWTFGVLPPGRITAMIDSSGRNWKDALCDHNGETLAELQPVPGARESELVVTLVDPVEVCGLRVVNRSRDASACWAVDGRSEAGGAWRELSGMFQDSGYFWSGPRFYYAGVSHRSEKIFAKTRVRELRLRKTNPPASGGASIETLQVLVPSDLRADLDMAAAALSIQEAGITSVYADRWHARELHRLSGGALWTSRETEATARNVLPNVRIPRADGVAVAVEDALAEATREALIEAGAETESFAAGGLTVFKLTPSPRAPAWKADLMFYAGMLHADRAPSMPPGSSTPDVAYFGDALRLRGVAPLRRLDARSAHVEVTLGWETVPGFVIPNNLMVSIHALDESGRIVSQSDERLDPDLNVYHGPLGTAFTTRHRLDVPACAKGKSLRLTLEINELGLLPRRAKPETALPVRKRRVDLPVTLADAAAWPAKAEEAR